MESASLNILVIGPHPDDQEIGMGGTIAKLAQQGHHVTLLDITDGSPTPRGDRASRLSEAAAALDVLQPRKESDNSSAKPIRRWLLDLPNRMVEHSISSRHAVAGAIRCAQANVLFVPQWEDAHPDHVATTRIAEDARFDAKLTKVEMPGLPSQPLEYVEAMRRAGARDAVPELGPPIYPKWVFYYDISHLRRVAMPSFCMDITGFERVKQAAIRTYVSQFGPRERETRGKIDTGKLVSTDLPERILAYSAYFGSRIGVAHAEPFFVREPIGLIGLSELA